VRFCPKTRSLWVALALLSAVNSAVFSQTGKCPADAEPRRIVLTIGINHYQHNDKWPNLTTAVNDANSLEEVLETKFGYQSYESLAKLTKADQLRNEKATRDAINTLVQDDLPQVLCSNDDFILFFSGHGDSRPYQNGSIQGASGYLIPVDGKEQGVSSLIEVKEFLENVGHLPARHILVILDACHSGIAIQDALQGMKSSGNYQAALASRNSRKVIVSAQANQTANDHGSIQDHSLFGGILFQGLDQGLAAKGKNFIPDSQLAEFVKEGVVEENPLQLPDSAPFLGNDGGALVLKLDQDLATLYRNALDGLATGNYDTFRVNSASAAQRSPDDPMTLELQYRLALSQGKVDVAAANIEKLRQIALRTHADADSLRLANSELLDIKHQLSFWKYALELPLGHAPPRVIIHAYTGKTENEQDLLQLSGSNEFSLAAEANLYFKLKARTEATYVYLFRIDKLGNIISEPDFLHQRENPVETDSERLTGLQYGPEPNDMEEWHFIFSSRPIDAFTSPPGVEDLAGATHYVVTIRPEE
jgi:hypothetical protein